MFRKSKALILCMLLSLGVLVPFESKAANVYYSQFEEPTVSEYCGYINLEIDFDNIPTGCVTLAWSIIPTEIKNDATLLPTTMMNITINERGVVLNTVGHGQADCHVLVWELNASDEYLILKNAYPSSGSVSISDGWNGKITGFSVYGNYGSISSYMGTYNPSCTVIWADEELALNRLTQISTMLSTLNSNLGGKLDTLVSKVSTLISEMDAVEETLADIENLVSEYMPMIHSELEDANQNLQLIGQKLDDLIGEQRTSNSWLEKIFDLLEEQPEEEKNAAQSQANQSTGDAQDSIEDKSEGFIDSLGGLTNLLSTDSTNATWTFPALYLPEIPGVMERTQLTSEQPIDFGYWVNQIPSRVMIVVRSLLTLGLIVFCFREFYGVIEYLLTLRGGRSNE